ncbi:MAG: exodeoxyribonuclease VII small subunit [Firmicutes bacterium]|nr:exodeoxyribonuclease VII small subunit [Bacillota bacterium]MBR0178849.1 exodeoxyribonuclease VII small subunit [Bacillota bacterium]
MARKGKTFEEQLGRLEETVQRLEQDELSLDEMLKLYAEGVELARSCRERLDEASARLQPEAGEKEDEQ